MFIVSDPTLFRNNVVKIVAKLLEIEPTTKTAINMEKAIYNYAIRRAKEQRGVVIKWEIPAFVQIYTDHLRTVLYNIEHTPQLKEGLSNLDIDPVCFVFESHQEWNPELWSTIIEEQLNKEIMKNNKKVASSTDMFVCRNCKNNKCTYYEMQTRSADESATIFVNCLTCGKKWRE